MLIFLHGVGGCGAEWEAWLRATLPPSTRLLLPTAATAAVAMYGGTEMNSWFNMYDSYTSNMQVIFLLRAEFT